MAGISCPEKENCTQERNINFKKRDIVNMISEEIPCPIENDDNPYQYACINDLEKPMQAMICYKIDKTAKAQTGTTKPADEISNLKASKSRELRAGTLYIGCDCEKRNGLQDDCRRTGCHGSPECLTKPNPICGPSEFSNGKHLLKKGRNSSSGGGSFSKAETGGKPGLDGYKCIPVIVKRQCCRNCGKSG